MGSEWPASVTWSLGDRLLWFGLGLGMFLCRRERGTLRQFQSGRGGVPASLLLCLGRVVRAWVLGSQGTRLFSSA